MKKYFFYSKNDPKKEPISSTMTSSRLKAAHYFSVIKKMTLKQFLSIFTINK
jgi:hypothetical protein